MSLEHELFEALGEITVIDTHTHLVGGALGARGLHDVLLYHMAVSDLYAAGCPSGARLTEFPGWPSREEASLRIEEALPFLPLVENTSTSWAIRIILRDLYEWHEPLTAGNWRRLDDSIQERSTDRAWQRDLLRRMRVRKIGTEWARREQGQDDDIFDYALEWAFFTRCQWGEYDTPLYELERCWEKSPEAPSPIGSGKRPEVKRSIASLDDIHEALASYVAHLTKIRLLSTATHLSTDLDYRVPTDVQMAAALTRRATAGPDERNIYAAYVHEHFLSALEKHAPHITFQFSLGAEPLPHETGSRIAQHTIAQLGDMISRHPGLKFQCFLSSRHANQSLCTMCRELPNFSLTGFWWHNFFPGAIRQVFEERLDMLPTNKHIGFFSDAYCLEWSYAKLVLVRRCMAEVFAQKIRMGHYDREMALRVARAILYDTPQTLLGFTPSPTLA